MTALTFGQLWDKSWNYKKKKKKLWFDILKVCKIMTWESKY